MRYFEAFRGPFYYFLFITLIGCASVSRVLNPEKGLYEALLRPLPKWQKEVRRAEKWHEDVIQQYAPTANLAMQKHAENIARRVAAVAKIPVPVKVTVLKGDDLNAFTIGGGFIYIFEGLMNMINNDDELALVIAHELAHCSAGHVGFWTWYSLRERIRPQGRPSFDVAIREEKYEDKGKRYWEVYLDAPSPEKAVDIIFNYITPIFQRWEEREADILGAYYAYKAGYDLNRGIECFRRIAREEAELRRRALEELQPLYLHLKDAFKDYAQAKKQAIENPFDYYYLLEANTYLKRFLKIKDEYLSCLYKWRDAIFEVPVWFRSHPPISQRVSYLKETLRALERNSINAASTKEVRYVLEVCGLIERGLPFSEKQAR